MDPMKLQIYENKQIHFYPSWGVFQFWKIMKYQQYFIAFPDREVATACCVNVRVIAFIES